LYVDIFGSGAVFFFFQMLMLWVTVAAVVAVVSVAARYGCRVPSGWWLFRDNLFLYRATI